MAYYLTKVFISAGLIVLVSELSKRSSFLGGLLASLPLISFLSFIWIYLETEDAGKVADLSLSVFWLVLPSLSLFLVLPWMLRRWSFPVSLTASTLVMSGFYCLTIFFVKKGL
jgi:hypothetical protein